MRTITPEEADEHEAAERPAVPRQEAVAIDGASDGSSARRRFPWTAAAAIVAALALVTAVATKG